MLHAVRAPDCTCLRNAPHAATTRFGKAYKRFSNCSHKTKTTTLSTRMCSETVANDGKWVIWAPKVAILGRYHRQAVQRPTVLSPYKTYICQIYTVYQVTSTAVFPLSPALWARPAAPQCPPPPLQSVSRQCADSSVLSLQYYGTIATRYLCPQGSLKKVDP